MPSRNTNNIFILETASCGNIPIGLVSCADYTSKKTRRTTRNTPTTSKRAQKIILRYYNNDCCFFPQKNRFAENMSFAICDFEVILCSRRWIWREHNLYTLTSQLDRGSQLTANKLTTLFEFIFATKSFSPPRDMCCMMTVFVMPTRSGSTFLKLNCLAIMICLIWAKFCVVSAHCGAKSVFTIDRETGKVCLLVPNLLKMLKRHQICSARH